MHFYDRDGIDITERAFKGGCLARMFCRAGIQHGKGAVADCWSNRFLFPGSIRREGVDCLAADLGRKIYGKIMKDTAQEQALLEVADLLQQLKILDNSTKIQNLR